MNPLLLAVMATLAQADGDAPSLGAAPVKPEAPAEPGAVAPADAHPPGPDRKTPQCALDHPRGPTALNTPVQPSNALNVASEEADCLREGGVPAMCSAEQAISQKAALCLAGMGAAGDVQLLSSGALDQAWTPSVTPRLVWRLSSSAGGCAAVTMWVDAWDGDVLRTSGCRKGRPCTIGPSERRAAAVRRQDWGAA